MLPRWFAKLPGMGSSKVNNVNKPTKTVVVATTQRLLQWSNKGDGVIMLSPLLLNRGYGLLPNGLVRMPI